MAPSRKRKVGSTESVDGDGQSTTDVSVTSVDPKSDSLKYQCLSVLFREKKGLKLSDDRLTVSSSAGNGYSTILATNSAHHGKWYFEAIVEELGDGGHFRVGWSTRRTRYDVPLGTDCFSYAIRDTDCARITLGHRWDSSISQSLTVGDVVGCLLELPDTVRTPKQIDDPLTFFPNLLCDPENVTEPEMVSDEGQSSIRFFLNGKPLDDGSLPSFTNLVKGEYYPAVSLFGKCKIRFDFTKHEKNFQAKPACDMYVPVELIKPRKRPANFIPRGLMSSGA
jgi:Set1/Ash2 histone methyltransferase complex subunit ASH2